MSEDVGDVVELTVGAPAHGGHCVARHDGRVVFVRHTLPGEVVRARLTAAEPGAKLWRADAVEVLSASPDRVDHPWIEAGAGGVGGAELGHVSRDGQLRWKQAVLADAFARFAGVPFPGTVSAVEGDAERGGLRWRTRVGATADADGKAAMHLPASKEIRRIAAMPLATEPAQRALLDGVFPPGSQLSVVSPMTPAGPGKASILVDGMPWTGTAIDVRDNAPRYVEETVTLASGVTHTYRVATAGFWQVHRGAPALLVGEVLKRVGGARRVADLYSGAGLFALALASEGREVVAVESDAGAARAARRNVHAHPEVRTIEGDVRRALWSQVGDQDAVVLDPPRSGAGGATIDALGETRAPRVVYVACDPVALARDVALLAERGYVLEGAQAFDLFPMTHHVETVATFTLR